MDFMWLFWGFYTLAFAAALAIVTYAVGWRSRQKGRLCSEMTMGTVVRYSAVRYNGVRLPVVEYVVDGQSYTVAGPKFKAGVTFTASVPVPGLRVKQTSNLNTREDLPDVLVRKQIRSSFGNGQAERNQTFLPQLYPVGSQAEVYYDPDKPKRSYVQRHVSPPVIFSIWIPLIASIVCIGLSVYFLAQYFIA